MYSVADEVWKMMLLTAKIAFNIFKGILSALGMLINYIMQLIDQKKFEKEQQQQRQQFERQNDNNNNNGCLLTITNSIMIEANPIAATTSCFAELQASFLMPAPIY